MGEILLWSPVPDWLPHRAHTRARGWAWRHIHQGPRSLPSEGSGDRQTLALLGDSFSRLTDSGGGEGRGPAWSGLTLQPASKVAPFELLSLRVGQQVSAEQGGPGEWGVATAQ